MEMPGGSRKENRYQRGLVGRCLDRVDGADTPAADSQRCTRLPLWRLTRTPTARCLYNALTAAGLRVAVLDEFVRDLRGYDRKPSPRLDGLSIEVTAPAERADQGRVSSTGREGADNVIGAVGPDGIVGEAYVSTGGPVFVAELDQRVSFDGGYIWGLAVAPTWRRRGIATALVETALQCIHHDGGSTAHALVAPDNHPSQSLFRGAEFTPIDRFVYLNVFGLEWRSNGTDGGEPTRGR